MRLAVEMAGPVPDERRLAELALSGELGAFRRIYERHAPAVLRFLCDLLGNASDAQEALQETFVRAHRGLAGVRERDRLLPWLMGVARNVAHEARRRSWRNVPAETVGLEERPHHGPSPEAEVLGREADEILAGAMAKLAPARRAALLLQMDHGLSYDEIAAAMEWSLAKVKIEIHRARQTLRAQVANYLEDT